MAALTDVTLTAGVGTGGTGTVSTLDKFNGTAGTPTTQVLTVQGVTSGTAVPVSIATAPVLVAGSALIGKVDVQFAGTAPTRGAGAVDANTQRVTIDSAQFGPLGATTKSASTSVARATDDVLGFTVVPSTTLTRAATTPTYASGQLFANSTTAASVTNLTWSTAARISGGSGVVIGAQIQKNGNTTTNAAFRVHLFTVAPTYVGSAGSTGDGFPLTTSVVASAKGYLGYIDISTMVGFSDVSWGSGAPDNTRGGLPFVAAAQSLFGLVEARGAYVGVSGEIITVFLDILQD